MTEVLFYVYAALVGAVLGSFLNVCMYRWPLGESVVRPRSRCPSCGSRVAWYDNVPVLSWVALRGRCRRCGAPISLQYPLVEAATAALWLAVALYHGPSVEAVRGGILMTLLFGIAIIDAKHRIIPDQFSLGGAAIGLLFAAWPGGFPLLAAVVGAVGGYLLFWLVKLVGEAALKKPALGVGDIHMMAMVGAFVGLAGALVTILLGSVAGLAVGVPIAALRGELKARGTYLPLGTFLAVGAAVAYLWGDPIIRWYLGVAVPA